VEFSLSAVAAANGSNGSSGGSNDGSSGSTSSRSLSKSLIRRYQVCIKEISEYIRTGSLAVQGRSDKQSRNQPNVTLLKAPELQYGLYFSSSIFRAVQLQDNVTNAASSAPASGPGSGAVSMLLGTVLPQIEAVAAAARQGSLQVALLPGDILTVGTAATAADTVSTAAASARGPAVFDYIDTFNVSDYT
jgi:hypothetical protein